MKTFRIVAVVFTMLFLQLGFAAKAQVKDDLFANAEDANYRQTPQSIYNVQSANMLKKMLKAEFGKDFNKAYNLKNAGDGFIWGGSCALGSGVGSLIANINCGDKDFLIGCGVVAALGGAFIGAGVPMRNAGIRKLEGLMDEYDRRHSTVSLTFGQGRYGTGLILTF